MLFMALGPLQFNATPPAHGIWSGTAGAGGAYLVSGSLINMHIGAGDVSAKFADWRLGSRQ